MSGTNAPADERPAQAVIRYAGGAAAALTAAALFEVLDPLVPGLPPQELMLLPAVGAAAFAGSGPGILTFVFTLMLLYASTYRAWADGVVSGVAVTVWIVTYAVAGACGTLLGLSWHRKRGRERRGQAADDVLRARVGELEAERARLMGELAVAERRFRAAFDGSPIGAALLSPDGRFREANAALCRILDRGPVELLQATMLSLTHPDDRADCAGRLAALLSGEVAHFLGRKRCVRPDGSVLAVEIFVTLVRRPDGAPADVLAQVTRAESDESRAAREREERLRTLADHLPSGFMFDAHEGADRVVRYRSVSAGVRALCGLTAREAVEQTGRFRDLVHPDDLPRLDAARASARASATPFDQCFRLRHADGRTRWARMRAVCGPSADGGSEWTGIVLDETELREGVDRLLGGEARLRTILTAMPDLVFVLDREGHFREVYTSRPDLLIQPPEVLIGSRLIDVMPDGLSGPAAQVFERVLSTGQVQGFEYALRRGAGAEFFEATLTPCGLDEVLLIARDVTGRRAAETAMRESEARFQAFMDNIPLGAWVLDADERVVYVNRRFGELAGVNPAAVLGQRSYDAYPPEVADRYRADDARVRAHGETVERQEAYIRGDGTRGDIMVLKFPIRRPGEEGAVGAVAVDISERVRFETVLRASESRTRAILDNSPATVAIQDLEGRYLFVNQRLAEVLGRTPDEAIGRLPSDLVPEAVARHWRDNDARALEAGRSGAFEEPVPGPEGERTFLTVKFPLRDETGAAVAVCAIGNDITERKRDEAERDALEAKFRDAQKLESLGVLVGGIAHDFNNLLTPILGYAQLLSEELGPDSPMRELIPPIERAAEQSAELCRQLLAYAGKGRFVVGPVSPNGLVSGMIELLRVSVSRRVSLSYTAGEAVPAVEADAAQLRQVVLNLVINAAEAIGDRPGLVTVSTGTEFLVGDRLRELSPPLDRSPGRFSVIEVEDNGSGMTPEVRRRIFEPFFTTKFTGRGLGLSAVLGIAKSHGGGLEIDSEPGRGTRIRLLLPALEIEIPPEAVTPEPAPRPPGGGLMLVIDDEESVRRTAATMVESFGYETLAFEDGSAAVDALSALAEPPVGALLDLTMPGLDGEATLRALREVRPDLPVVLMSGYSESELQARFADCGFSGFLQKPFRLEHLAARLLEIAVPAGAAP